MDSAFVRIPGFCPDCGSILPPLYEKGGLVCYTCSKTFTQNVESAFGSKRVTYTIHFNSREAKKKNVKEENNEEDEGPVVDRKCPKCGNEKMSYATLQLRFIRSFTTNLNEPVQREPSNDEIGEIFGDREHGENHPISQPFGVVVFFFRFDGFYGNVSGIEKTDRVAYQLCEIAKHQPKTDENG
ncbi:unnamed protein product [Phyllotreta striolata]|uniref:DNA-directed RNA polymerase M/15kDa subunit domain-containing protein n=1 Tax=Phyllotreta striolata TaxID=444603 RepID=A0A9N9TL48_PHYSR|nr:unnamed protein product [Phyllotreta striolata]